MLRLLQFKKKKCEGRGLKRERRRDEIENLWMQQTSFN